MKDTLVQIARTAVLCGALGLALYFAMSYAAQFSAFAPAFGLAASAALAGLLAWSVRHALRDRIVPMRVQSISRDEQPLLYWGFVGFEAACAGACVVIAVMCAVRLIEGGVPPR